MRLISHSQLFFNNIVSGLWFKSKKIYMKWGELMEGTFINFLNGILPYLGTGLAVITVSGSLIIGAYKGIKKLISAHDVKIADNIRNQEENDEFKEQISNFASTLTNVCNKVDEMNERQLAQIEHNNAVDIKLDELSDSIKRDRHDSVRADEEIKKYDITIIPLSVMIDGAVYVERETITNEQFPEMMKNAKSLPKTSQPPIGKFVDAFDKLGEDGSEVLCVTMMESISGTVHAAEQAAGMTKTKVTVYDSQSTDQVMGFEILEAAQVIEAGGSVEDAIAKMKEVLSKSELYLAIDNLDNLVAGGRISKFAGAISNLLNIKVMLHVYDGQIHIESKGRGIKSMHKEWDKKLGNDGPEYINMLYESRDIFQNPREVEHKILKWCSKMINTDDKDLFDIEDYLDRLEGLTKEDLNRTQEDKLKKLAEATYNLVNGLPLSPEKRRSKGKEMVDENTKNQIKKAMKNGFMDNGPGSSDKRKYGISRENIHLIFCDPEMSTDPINREMLDRLINKFEADGIKFKYETDDEWRKAGLSDPFED